MSKKIVITLGVIILILAVGGGSFYGGTAYAQAQAAAQRNAFFAARGGGNGGGSGGGGGGGFGGFGGADGAGGGNGGRVAGQVKSIDGNTLTISTPQNVATVTLTDSTTYSKMVNGALTDLKPGETVTVRGTRDSSGNITATSVQILNQPTTAAVP